jgi:hypothetical protein
MSTATNFEYPGVRVTEATAGAIPIDRLSFRAIKLNGTSMRGPAGVSGALTRSSSWNDIYGPRTPSSYIDDAIDAIFQNCDSSEVYFNRILGAGNAKASALLGKAGTPQVETATVLGTIGASGVGNATVIVTAAGMTGSPKTFNVAVANNDTAAQVAGKIRTALAADAAVTALFTVGGAGADVVLTRLAGAANDSTLNISIANGTCTGLTAAPTSANTTPGVAGADVLRIDSIGPGTDYNYVASPAHGISVSYADGRLTIYDGGVALEAYNELTFDNPSQVDLVNASSSVVQLTWLDDTVNPEDTSVVQGLTGGLDGAAVVAADIAGDSELGTGIWKFANKDLPIGFILAPGYSQEVVNSALISMAEQWRHLALLDSPLGTTVSGAITDRNQYASPKGHAVYCYGWVQVNDPLSRQLKWVPRSSFRAAHIARSHNQPGFLANVGAGLDYVLRGAAALETGTMDDLTQGTINVKGIDVARNFNPFGQGLVHWSARTIATNPLYRFLQVRIILNVIAESIEIGLRPYIFRVYDGRGKLAAEIKGSIDQLLWDLWNQDVLFGGAPGQAFLVKNVSTLGELEQGIVNLEVYVKPTPVVERINVTLFRVPLNFDFNTGAVTIGEIQSQA